MITLKKAVKNFIVDARKAHEHAKADLLKAIDNQNLTGTFGDAYIDEVKRTESVVNQIAMTLTPEYLESEEFANTSEEEFRTWLVDFNNGLRAREDEHASRGFNQKHAWVLSGMSQVRVFLDRALKNY